MIASSRVALLLALALVVASCEEKVCTTQGCLSGLTVELDGAVDGGIQATPFQIDFAKVVDQQVTPLTTCTFTAANAANALVCSPEVTHAPLGSDVVFADTDVRMLRVTISSNGNVLSEQTVTPVYTSREVWGPGCGTCTQATVKVDLPPP